MGNQERDHNGKKYTVNLAVPIQGGGKSQEQSYHYPKATWTEAEARAHCQSHGGGTFEPAAGENKELIHNNTIISPEPIWSSIATKKLPLNAFAPSARGNRMYGHHWVKGGEVCRSSGEYIGGEMYLHKGGLIESFRRAQREGAPKEMLDHLRTHCEEVGIDMSFPKTRTPPAPRREATPEDIFKGIIQPSDATVSIMDDRIATEIEPVLDKDGKCNISDEDMAAIQKVSMVPLDRKEIFAFPMYISNGAPDTKWTRMDPATTLPNFVSDLKDSRSLCLAHGPNKLLASLPESMPIGNAFTGDLVDRPGHEGKWVRGMSYIVRGVKVGSGMTTDDIIRHVSTGVWRRGSAGFTILPMGGRSAGHYQCEVCNRDLSDPACEHLPGLTYDGNRAIAKIVNGGLREISLVYMNSASGAVVGKARALAEAGILKGGMLIDAERMFGVDIFQHKIIVPAPGAGWINRSTNNNPGPSGKPGNENQKERSMDAVRQLLKDMCDTARSLLPEGALRRKIGDTSRKADAAETEEALTGAYGELKANLGEAFKDHETHRAVFEALPEEQRTVDGARKLVDQAKLGVVYHADLVKEALAQGVRSDGNAFKNEHWQKVLATATPDFIKDQTRAWKESADAKIKGGGQTAEIDPTTGLPKGEDPSKTKAGNVAPDAAFRTM